MLLATKLYSIFNNKCPKCHKGDFFINKNPYKKGFIQMHQNCTNCNELFSKEVGFFYGAMYVSYGVNIIIGVGLFLLMVTLLKTSLLFYLFAFFGIELLLFPITMRISRLIYSNIFVKFDPTSH